MAQRDGVADGWILYEAWCKRNGGIPIRGRNGGQHVCLVGPTDQTIDPGDEGTVDLVGPGGGGGPLEDERLKLQLQAAKLAALEAQNRYERVEQLITGRLKKSAK